MIFQNIGKLEISFSILKVLRLICKFIFNMVYGLKQVYNRIYFKYFIVEGYFY